ncbi:MAG: electron transfer flavoprotein subunit beta/FixA family protein [Chloroflexota bacterium]
MKIVVPIRLVPDLVEELTIDDSGTALDMSWLRLIINEFDDHAMEQAILIKERSEAQVTVLSLDMEGIDDVLFTASAKGADTLIKIIGNPEEGVNSHALSRILANEIKGLQPDLVLTGVQAHSDLDGSVGPLLAELLGMPYVGYVAEVSTSDGKAIVKKEYPGGLIAQMEIKLPAVLGIQAAEQPPRYVAVSKVRQAMKSATIEEHDISALDPSGGLPVSRMFQPEATEKATMIEGDEEAVSEKLVEIFSELGII